MNTSINPEMTPETNETEPLEQKQESPSSVIDEQTESDALAKLQAEITESKDKYIRLYAEFDNFRRRTSKEKMEMITTANEQLIQSLLTVIDDMERARISMENTDDRKAILEGLDLVFTKFKKTLESKGLKALESKGKDFNPDVHEAITQIPSPTDDLKGKIVDEIEKGYFLNDKLIRVAKVVVGN